MSGTQETEFFTLHHATEGVWAAIAVPGSGAQGNAAIVDLGDVTIVVDTFMVPQAAEQLHRMFDRADRKTCQICSQYALSRRPSLR